MEQDQQRILLFYKYITLADPGGICRWVHKLCFDLELRGRIILATEGINGTLGGHFSRIARFKEVVGNHPLFGGIDWKESCGGAEHFPRLRVVVKNEITHLGLDTARIRAQDGGIHLKPEETHALLSKKPDNLVVFDARNNFETAIGAFKDAIIPDINYFRQLPGYIDANLEQFKDKEVLMYCTGGIRCERASAYLKSKGVARKVYQMEGGIQRYTEKYPEGFFRGKNYVFDGRVAVRVTDDVLGVCFLCATSCDDYTNCLNASCNNHFIACSVCLASFENTCSSECQQLLLHKKVKPRPARAPVQSTDARR